MPCLSKVRYELWQEFSWTFKHTLRCHSTIVVQMSNCYCYYNYIDWPTKPFYRTILLTNCSTEPSIDNAIAGRYPDCCYDLTSHPTVITLDITIADKHRNTVVQTANWSSNAIAFNITMDNRPFTGNWFSSWLWQLTCFSTTVALACKQRCYQDIQ